jgi:hypothetical protein
MRREHFIVCLGTFNIDLTFGECLRLFSALDLKNNDYLEEAEFIRGVFQAIPPTGIDYGHQLFSDEVLSATNRASLNGRYNR